MANLWLDLKGPILADTVYVDGVLAAEAELENVHSGIACCLEHSLNLIGKEAKVLRYQLNIAKICLYCTEKLH